MSVLEIIICVVMGVGVIIYFATALYELKHPEKKEARKKAKEEKKRKKEEKYKDDNEE